MTTAPLRTSGMLMPDVWHAWLAAPYVDDGNGCQRGCEALMWRDMCEGPKPNAHSLSICACVRMMACMARAREAAATRRSHCMTLRRDLAYNQISNVSEGLFQGLTGLHTL